MNLKIITNHLVLRLNLKVKPSMTSRYNFSHTTCCSGPVPKGFILDCFHKKLLPEALIQYLETDYNNSPF